MAAIDKINFLYYVSLAITHYGSVILLTCHPKRIFTGDVMLWLDSVLAVPAMGIRIENKISTAVKVQEKVAEILDTFKEQYGDTEISVKDVWGYEVKSKSGYLLSLSPNNIYGGFSYNQEKEETAGGFVSMKHPEVIQYSRLFDEITDYILKTLEIVCSFGNIKVRQIGIVANVSSDNESLAPGFSAWLDSLSKPWGADIYESNTKLLVNLNETDSLTERCHHVLKFSKDHIETHGYKVLLDWQRLYHSENSLKFSTLRNTIAECKDLAMSYFNKFVEGDLNYD